MPTPTIYPCWLILHNGDFRRHVGQSPQTPQLAFLRAAGVAWRPCNTPARGRGRHALGPNRRLAPDRTGERLTPALLMCDGVSTQSVVFLFGTYLDLYAFPP